MNTIKWTTEKPEAQAMVLITAVKPDKHWEYQIFEIEWCGIWAVYQDGDEWGEYEHLQAHKYGVIKPLE